MRPACTTSGLCALALTCTMALAPSCEEDPPRGPQGLSPLPGAPRKPDAVEAAAASDEDPRLARALEHLRARRFAQARDVLVPAGSTFPEAGSAARDFVDRIDREELVALARAGMSEQAGRLLDRRSPTAREDLLSKPLDATSPLLDHCLVSSVATPGGQRGRSAPFPPDQPPKARIGKAPPLDKLAGTYRLRSASDGGSYRLELREEGGKLRAAGWAFPHACPAVLFDSLFEPGRLLLVHREEHDSPFGLKEIVETDLSLDLDSSGALAGPYGMATSSPVVSDIRESRLDCERGTAVRELDPPAIACWTEDLSARPPWATLSLSSDGGLPSEEWLRRVGQPVGQDGVRVAWAVGAADPPCPREPWLGSTRMTGVVSRWDLLESGIEVDIQGSGPGSAARRCKARFGVVPRLVDRLDFAKGAAQAVLGGKAASARGARCESGRCLELGPYPLVCADSPGLMHDAPTLVGRVRATAGTTALDVRYRVLATVRRQARADLVVATPGVPASQSAIEIAPSDLKPSGDRRYRFDSGWKTAHVAVPAGAASPAEIGFEFRGTTRWCRRFIPHGRERNEGEALLLVQSVAASARR